MLKALSTKEKATVIFIVIIFIFGFGTGAAEIENKVSQDKETVENVEEKSKKSIDISKVDNNIASLKISDGKVEIDALNDF
ncbi:MAG: hypothetical protein Q9M91_04760 [Candidatus Dojkabacteria bacterium]|nr:hypothetical protein [Candidatus Dojkabacteria bacterium]MDQ7021121.1 hypothetical protein [Candidatus Dojkabacteria bacterium]